MLLVTKTKSDAFDDVAFAFAGEDEKPLLRNASNCPYSYSPIITALLMLYYRLSTDAAHY